jgi:benzoyl-CoA 2,3-dioxygenase component B
VDELAHPHRRFYRQIGSWANLPFDTEGRLLSREEWDKKKDEWLPSGADRGFVRSLMHPVRAPGKIANWIGKPARGIKGLPFEYEYVRLG